MANDAINLQNDAISAETGEAGAGSVAFGEGGAEPNAAEAVEEAAEKAAVGTAAVYNGWLREAAAVSALYPGFDLTRMARNPAFTALLARGVPVRAAYEVCDRDAIHAELIGRAARAARERVLAGIRSRRARPSENGLSGRGGQALRHGASGLTKSDRAAIADRVARGEKVSF